ncbi:MULTISPECIES: TetR/AcrR family transcriptional regulator [Frankia]|uniref:TetR-family transcriptional regulator n=2 Tax=Frankia TaxID=1854 RepID=Q0RMZ4_FRAAA|nr:MULTISPECIES: TetR/AcrR family transcriptional regulator [Frankia]CAJ61102.1 putative TetR-family transcriptional regulator [Frankia alni ACN14a]
MDRDPPGARGARTVETRTPRQGVLHEAEIVASALSIIERDGVEGLTMRRLSQSLGVSLGATYKHVATKDDLLRLVTAELYTRVLAADTPDADWRPRLRSFLLRMHEVVGTCRGLAAHLAAHADDPVTARLYYPLHAALTQAGFTPAGADRVLRTLFFYTSGALLTPASDPARERAAADFAAGLDMVLDGVAHALPAEGDPAS